MALFRNLGVKLRACLCDIPRYASAQPLVFLDLVENCSFLSWKLLVPIDGLLIHGWALVKGPHPFLPFHSFISPLGMIAVKNLTDSFVGKPTEPPCFLHWQIIN